MSDNVQENAPDLDLSSVLVSVRDFDLFSEIATLLKMENLRSRYAPTHEIFLKEFYDRPTGVVIIEESLPTLSKVRRMSPRTAAVFLSSTGSVADARQAFLHGARDVLSVPIPPAALIDVTRSVAPQPMRRTVDVPKIRIQGLDALTPREAEVLSHLLEGFTNKETGLALGISPRTVEVHRARIMTKMQVRTTAQMVKKALSNSSHPS